MGFININDYYFSEDILKFWRFEIKDYFIKMVDIFNFIVRIL